MDAPLWHPIWQPFPSACELHGRHDGACGTSRSLAATQIAESVRKVVCKRVSDNAKVERERRSWRPNLCSVHEVLVMQWDLIDGNKAITNLKPASRLSWSHVITTPSTKASDYQTIILCVTRPIVRRLTRRASRRAGMQGSLTSTMPSASSVSNSTLNSWTASWS